MVNKRGNPNFANRQPEFPLVLVRTISLAVYKDRMGADDFEALLAKDNDDGKKMRSRSECMDELTRCYLRAFRDRGVDVLAGG